VIDASALDEPILLVEDLGPVRRLTMNRPKSLNALNGELIEALSAALATAATDDAVHVLVLRGAGRAFCAGYDLKEDASAGALDSAAWHAELERSTARMLQLLDHPKPIVASVHSYCLAGGTDLMLACDLAVAADDAYFGYWTSASARAWYRCSSPGSSASARPRSCCSPARTGSPPTRRFASVS
jgi:enoyl-CoA hydratase